MKKNLIGHVRTFAENIEETRTVEFVASDNTRDAHGTVIPVDKWDLERFNSNGIIGYQHNVYGDLCGNDNPDNVIGKGFAFVEDEKLIVRVTFEPAGLNPLAEKIFRKILFGSLNAVSVGFIETCRGCWGEGEEAEDGTNPTYYYGGQELLEMSVINIPSNRNVLKRAFRENTVDAIHFIYKALDGKYRYADIEEMKVRDVLDLLEGRVGGDTRLRRENVPEMERADEVVLAEAVMALAD